MYLKILTPDENIFDGEVSKSTFPGSNGSFQVLNDHAPLVSPLSYGMVKFTTSEGENREVKILGGVVEVLENEISLLADGVVKV